MDLSSDMTAVCSEGHIYLQYIFPVHGNISNWSPSRTDTGTLRLRGMRSNDLATRVRRFKAYFRMSLRQSTVNR